jgi:hypothetical protein
MINQELTLAILKEVDGLLKRAVVPVSNDRLDRLSQEGHILEHLLAMKTQGIISGDVITIGSGGTPHRMTNIKLTYLGLRTLRQGPGEA